MQKNKTTHKKSNPIDVCSLSKKLVNQQQLFGEGYLEWSEHFWSLVLRRPVFFPEWSAPSGPSLRQCQARLMARPSSWQGTFRRVSSVQEWSLFRKCYHVGWGNLEAALFFFKPATSKSVRMDVTSDVLADLISLGDSPNIICRFGLHPVSRL